MALFPMFDKEKKEKSKKEELKIYHTGSGRQFVFSRDVLSLDKVKNEIKRLSKLKVSA